jgi:hypothetical protein
VKGAVEVDVDDGLPGVLREVLEGRGKAPTGVVHEDVDIAELGDHLVDERLDAVAVADVTLGGVDRPAVGLDVVDDRLEAVTRPRTDGDVDAVVCEFLGDGLADSLRCTRHDRRLAVDVEL